MALAGDIAAGRIDVYPYRLGTQTACAYCEFKAVCRFDWQINEYNPMNTKTKIDVIEALGGS